MKEVSDFGLALLCLTSIHRDRLDLEEYASLQHISITFPNFQMHFRVQSDLLPLYSKSIPFSCQSEHATLHGETKIP